MLDYRLDKGGYAGILLSAGMKDAPREEQIRVLNEALHDITDEVAMSSEGLGVGYYSRELDAILTYGPSADYQQMVGVSIGQEHPGRRVMATGVAEVSMGSMVRGNIMNAMLPVVRSGEVIGYIWANNLVSELENSLARITTIILILLILSYLIILIMIVIFIRRMINTEQTYMRALSKALEEAQDATRAKSSFLSTMSHEIRTPLNAILGITEIQLQNESIDTSMKEALDKIFVSGDLLLGIINDILDLSKIEAGKLELTTNRYELASLISDTAQLNMMRIGSKEIEFELDVDEHLPMHMSGDELRIRQILNNLLSNAFKYTERGVVKLSVTTDGGDACDAGENGEVTLVLIVSDTGHGMSKEQVDKLFDEYARFNTEANRMTEGTGLGMSITQNLIRLMNGEIHVESEPGKGSTFTVRLPQGRTEAGELGREMAENLHMFRTSNWSQMKRVQITREPMPYGSVLIVDDVETNIYVARGLLAPYGLQIDSVDSGFAAIEKVRDGNVYDVIFMDHMMPKMDGVEATKIIMDMGYDKPIVALTANAVSGQAEIFFKNGFADFISKPIDIRELNSILNKLVRDKQPAEVLEAARKSAEEKSGLSAKKAPIIIGARFAEIFSRDAVKTLTALEEICGKNDFSDSDNLRSYIINVHGIKSALANIGRADLSDAAKDLEIAARENNFDVLASGTPAFMDDLRALVEELAQQIETVVIDKVDEDRDFLRKMLFMIKAACEEYDVTTSEETLTELQKAAWSEETEALLASISEQLLFSSFDEIVETINTFLDDESK